MSTRQLHRMDPDEPNDNKEMNFKLLVFYFTFCPLREKTFKRVFSTLIKHVNRRFFQNLVKIYCYALLSESLFLYMCKRKN